MSINQLHTEIDALTVAAPNFAAVRMIAGLRGISFHEAMIAQAQEWATALDEAIARETAEAAMYIRQGESTTHPNQRAAWHTEATKHLDEAARLSNVRVIAACMLADTDTNPVDQAPTNPR